MTQNTIYVRDFQSGSAVPCETSYYSSTGYHTPHHVYRAAIPADMVYGVASSTDTSDHALISAPAASPATTRNYVHSIQCANSGGSASLVRIIDGAASSPDVALAYIYVPAGNTITAEFIVPLKGSIGNPIYFSCGTSTTTMYVSAQGFIGE